jgi:hypothetical protein
MFAWEYDDGSYDYGSIVEMPTYTVNGGSGGDPHWGIPEGAGDLPPSNPPYTPPEPEGGSDGGGGGGGATNSGGSIITSMGNASFIPNTQTSVNHKGITITGTAEEVQKAKDWIDEIIKDPDRKALLEFLVAEADRNNKVVSIQFGDLNKSPLGWFTQTEQRIDMNEVNKLPMVGPASQFSIFMHEVFEQLYYQAYAFQKTFEEVHQMALNLEREISGHFRYKDDEIYTNLLGGYYIYSYYQSNTNANAKYEVKYSIDTQGNVTSISTTYPQS